MASPGGVPAGTVGASTPLPPEAEGATARRSWGTNVREVGSDAELRKALVDAGTQTVSTAVRFRGDHALNGSHARRLLSTSARRGAKSARRLSPSSPTWASRHVLCGPCFSAAC